MTSSAQHLRKPPTDPQLALIPKLCAERGVSFDGPPASARQADEQIKALLAIPRHRGDRIEDRETLEEGFEQWGGACAIHEEEIEGYGSSARWARRTL